MVKICFLDTCLHVEGILDTGPHWARTYFLSTVHYDPCDCKYQHCNPLDIDLWAATVLFNGVGGSEI